MKVSFFQGARLDPSPEEESKYPASRHHGREGEELGEQFTSWVRQAGELPGEKM